MTLINSPVKSRAFCGSLTHLKNVSCSHADWCLSHAKMHLACDVRPQFSTRGQSQLYILYVPNTRLASFPKENLGTRLERLLVSFPEVRDPCHVHADLSQAVDLGLEFSSRECLSKWLWLWLRKRTRASTFQVFVQWKCTTLNLATGSSHLMRC